MTSGQGGPSPQKSEVLPRTGSDSCVGGDFGALTSLGAAKSTINSMETVHKTTRNFGWRWPSRRVCPLGRRLLMTVDRRMLQFMAPRSSAWRWIQQCIARWLVPGAALLWVTAAPCQAAEASGPADATDAETARTQTPSAAKPSQSASPDVERTYADTDSRALTDFRPYVDPYGSWVQDPDYGLVWIPSAHVVGTDFAPYVTSGHWALSRSGEEWVWVSDYPFGWVVFHYGRWVRTPSWGWVWIPGRRYAPAWVIWRVEASGYGYVGWAPAPPSYIWVDGSVWWLYYRPPIRYVFCPKRYVFYPRFYSHLVRDRALVRRLGRRSRRTPWRGITPASPTLAEAGIPARAVVTPRVSAVPRTVAPAVGRRGARAVSLTRRPAVAGGVTRPGLPARSRAASGPVQRVPQQVRPIPAPARGLPMGRGGRIAPLPGRSPSGGKTRR